MTYTLAHRVHFQRLFGREEVMKNKLLPLMLLAGGSLFASTHFSVGVGIGIPEYYAPPAAVAVQPPCPGPGYTWVDGYYQPNGAWIAGYWAPPVRAYVTPHFTRGFDDHRFHDHDRGRGFVDGHRR